jgi:hypothetical protein
MFSCKLMSQLRGDLQQQGIDCVDRENTCVLMHAVCQGIVYVSATTQLDFVCVAGAGGGGGGPGAFGAARVPGR